MKKVSRHSKEGREIALDRFDQVISEMEAKMERFKNHPKAKKEEIMMREIILSDLREIRTMYNILLQDNIKLRTLIIDFVEAIPARVMKQKKVKEIYSRMEKQYQFDQQNIKINNNGRSKRLKRSKSSS